MNKVKVITDSTSDLNRTLREQFDIDYLKMTFMIDNKVYDADLDWDQMNPKEFYSQMRSGKRIITGLIKTNEAEEKFNKYLSQGYDILYIGCSCCLSGSVNCAKIIASDFVDAYPDQKIICLDSMRSNCAEGMIAIQASLLAQKGYDVNHIANYLYEERLKFQTYGVTSSLNQFKKSGRVKTVTSLIDNIPMVKSIIVSDANGYNYAYKSCPTQKKAFDYLAGLIQKRVGEDNPVVFVEHSDCYEEAKLLVSTIKEKTGLEHIHLEDLGPIIGATVGPGFISVSFYGKRVTLSSE